MPLPPRVWRLVYDRESAAWQRRRDDPARAAQVERAVDLLTGLVEPPGPVADLGCGPGAHARALAQRGFTVIALDGSPRMIERARERATSEGVDVSFDAADLSGALPFGPGVLGGALAVLLIQHLPDGEAFVREVARCLRPGGALLLTAPARSVTPVSANLFWRLRALVARGVPGVIRLYEVADLEASARAAGLTVTSSGDDLGGAWVLARR